MHPAQGHQQTTSTPSRGERTRAGRSDVGSEPWYSHRRTAEDGRTPDKAAGKGSYVHLRRFDPLKVEPSLCHDMPSHVSASATRPTSTEGKGRTSEDLLCHTRCLLAGGFHLLLHLELLLLLLLLALCGRSVRTLIVVFIKRVIRAASLWQEKQCPISCTEATTQLQRCPCARVPFSQVQLRILRP